jgi:hypothetical protein
MATTAILSATLTPATTLKNRFRSNARIGFEACYHNPRDGCSDQTFYSSEQLVFINAHQ